jgi:hypothetical protein
VAPGEYIGRKTYVKLPLWSAGVGSYTFRALSDDVKRSLGFTTSKDKTPKGYFLQDFTSKNLLIDFTGGKAKEKVGTQLVSDDAASELLILRADGRIEVRNEITDASIKERKERETLWTKWLAQVAARKDQYLGDPMGSGEGSGGRTESDGRDR